jgi:hypothetical protein
MSSAADLVAERYARGTAVAALVITLLWHTVNDATAIVVSWKAYRWPAVEVVSWFVCLSIALLGADAILRRRSALRVTWPLAAVTLLVVIVVAAGCRNPDLITVDNWAWGFVGWLGVLLLWHHPLRDLIAFFVLTAGASLAAMISAGQTDRISLARFAVVMCGATVLQGGFAGGARALNAAAAWTASASAARGETELKRAAAQEANAARRRRYRQLERTAAQLLVSLANGRSDPADPTVQRQCAAEAARLRRLFVETDDLPDPLVHELRACTDVAERKGVVVDLVTVGHVPPIPVEVRRALTEAPIEVMTAARTRARITLLGSADEVAVSVVADCEEDRYATTGSAGVVVSSSHQDGQTWVETRWVGPSPAKARTGEQQGDGDDEKAPSGRPSGSRHRDRSRPSRRRTGTRTRQSST